VFVLVIIAWEAVKFGINTTCKGGNSLFPIQRMVFIPNFTVTHAISRYSTIVGWDEISGC